MRRLSSRNLHWSASVCVSVIVIVLPNDLSALTDAVEELADVTGAVTVAYWPVM